MYDSSRLQPIQYRQHLQHSSNQSSAVIPETSTKKHAFVEESFCRKHQIKIQELMNRLQDLKLNQMDLKIKNNQLIKMISQQSEDYQQANERNTLWLRKYQQLVLQNQRKKQQIKSIVAPKQKSQQYSSQKNIVYKRYDQNLYDSQENEKPRSKQKFINKLSQRECQYLARLSRQSSKRKQRSKSIRQRNSVKEVRANLGGGIIIKILDQRGGIGNQTTHRVPLGSLKMC